MGTKNNWQFPTHSEVSRDAMLKEKKVETDEGKLCEENFNDFLKFKKSYKKQSLCF